MDQTGFRNLCRAASVALGCADPDALGSTNTIDLAGTQIGLFFDEDMTPDRIFCYIDVGQLPATGREAILERILALNLLTATKTAGIYGLDQGTDSLIFVQHFIYPELMSGDDLAGILQGYSEHAGSLRQNLLDPSNLRPVPEILADSLNPGTPMLA
ncbi:MAG: hypothetical protein RL404_2490 [Pseudomonadota bacterium]|jgi:hypothetical protein